MTRGPPAVVAWLFEPAYLIGDGYVRTQGAAGAVVWSRPEPDDSETDA